MSTNARYTTSLVWMRRDLRLTDHVALDAAARSSERVVCAFVLDEPLLRGPRVGAPIVQFFFDSLGVLREQLRVEQSDLALLQGDFAAELVRLAQHVGAQAVFYNVDYDPAMVARDEGVVTALRAANLAVHAHVDHVYFAADEIVAPSGKPYTVYTPYRRRWQAAFQAQPHAPVATKTSVRGKFAAANVIGPTHEVPTPEVFGHRSSPMFPAGGAVEAQRRLDAFIGADVTHYLDQRNFPAVAGTSHLSPHLRAGTIGIRTCIAAAFNARTARGPGAANVDGWIGELIWRDFYQSLLVHFPRIAYEPFIEAGKAIPYRNDEAGYRAWCSGATGYPIVDAAMVQLNTTGWMHNRLRMVVASFLTKHLLIDYHDGERYFEEHLADADLAANMGGWQWSASVGTDAAPYFRVFNPTLQGKTFDPDGAFVRSMLPALARVPLKFIHEPWMMPPLIAGAAGFRPGDDYPAPIVDHAGARTRAIAVYSAALKRPDIQESNNRRAVKS